RALSDYFKLGGSNRMIATGNVLTQRPQRLTSDKAPLSDSSKKCIERALERIAGAWKSFDPVLNGRVYRDEIKAMIVECGEQRVERGISAAIRTHLEFVPSIAHLWEYVRSAGAGGKR